MELGFYRFDHSYMSRSGNKYRGPSKKGHLGAATNYYANINKVSATLAINLPTDRRELMSAMWGHDNKITRANGRIAETLILSFDRRMSLEHRKEAAHHFMVETTLKEQIKAVAFLHDNDASNPHAHIIVLDSNSDGKPVGHFGRSGTYRREHSPIKGNPTEWLRKQWEESCNFVLEEHDYPFRVDRRSNLDRAVDKPREPVLDAPESPEVQVEPASEQPPPDDMRKIVTEHHRQPYEKVLDALDHHNNLQALETVEHRIDYLEKEADRLTAESAHLKEEARKNEREATAAEGASAAAAEGLKDYTRHDGSLKGFHVKLWRFEWRSPARREGERLTGEKEFQDHIHSSRTRQANELRYSAGVAENQATTAKLEHERAKYELEAAISQFGDKVTLDTAREILTNSMYSDLSEVTPDEIYADFENGFLEPHEAKQAFELMGQHAYISRVEAREREEEAQLEI